jgi:hypothetical protein
LTIDPKWLERGYRVEEDVSPDGHRGWFYGRSSPDGKLADRVGPFESSAEAVKHLEGELFSDEED